MNSSPSWELELGSLLGVDVNDERLHVASGLLLSQRVILHVLAGIGGVVRETDAAVALAVGGPCDNRPYSVAVVEECSQTDAQCAGYLDQRPQRGQVLIILYGRNLLDGQAASLSNLLEREVL